MILTHFNAQLKSHNIFAKSLSGRLGPFIFRTYPDGDIRAYYMPKIDSSTTQSIVDYESLYSQLREIVDTLNLEIIQITCDYE